MLDDTTTISEIDFNDVFFGENKFQQEPSRFKRTVEKLQPLQPQSPPFLSPNTEQPRPPKVFTLNAEQQEEMQDTSSPLSPPLPSPSLPPPLPFSPLGDFSVREGTQTTSKCKMKKIKIKQKEGGNEGEITGSMSPPRDKKEAIKASTQRKKKQTQIAGKYKVYSSIELIFSN